jgi:hypothetical protein
MQLTILMLANEVGASAMQKLLIQGGGDDFLIGMMRQPALAAAHKTG